MEMIKMIEIKKIQDLKKKLKEEKKELNQIEKRLIEGNKELKDSFSEMESKVSFEKDPISFLFINFMKLINSNTNLISRIIDKDIEEVLRECEKYE